MKENTKITLTYKQLKQLIKESTDSVKNKPSLLHITYRSYKLHGTSDISTTVKPKDIIEKADDGDLNNIDVVITKEQALKLLNLSSSLNGWRVDNWPLKQVSLFYRSRVMTVAKFIIDGMDEYEQELFVSDWLEKN